MSLLKSLSKLLTLASLNSFHSLEYMTQTLVRFMVPPATAPAAVPDGIFVRDNRSRTHLALAKDAPESRAIMSCGEIVAISQVGGLHRRYERRAA